MPGIFAVYGLQHARPGRSHHLLRLPQPIGTLSEYPSRNSATTTRLSEKQTQIRSSGIVHAPRSTQTKTQKEIINISDRTQTNSEYGHCLKPDSRLLQPILCLNSFIDQLQIFIGPDKLLTSGNNFRSFYRMRIPA